MKKKIWAVTLFPEYFYPLLKFGKAGSIFRPDTPFDFEIVDMRSFSVHKYGNVDDYPYGGGPGMIIRPDVLKGTLNFVKEKIKGDEGQGPIVIYTSPRGEKWDHIQAKSMAQKFSNDIQYRNLVFICGRYEGVDDRFINLYVDEEYSLGDFVTTGGEIPVMAMIDSFLRYLPGVLGNKRSSMEDSFENQLLEHPQYTRPRIFDGVEVPATLLSGNHREIEKFREKERWRITLKHRPDLISSEERDEVLK